MNGESPGALPAARAILGRDSPWLVLLSVALGLFMVVVNISIVNIAMPAIAGEMQASLAEVQWTLISYTLVLTGLVPVFGRISDVLGRKRLFIAGVLVFGVAGAAAALAPSIIWLIVVRLVQAVGGALITSNVLAIIADTFPAGKRGAAMGVQAILVSGGAAVGPTLGGFLVTHFGWQAIFLVNVPLGLVSVLFAVLLLPTLQSHRTLEPIDWVGAALLTGGMGTLLLGITKGHDWGWASAATLISTLGGVATLVLFAVRELRARHPLVDLSLFKIRPFAAGQGAGLFATIAMSTMMLLLPFYWQGLRGYSAQSAGLLMLPLPLMLMLVAPLAGRLSDRTGARGIATTGLGIIMVGLLLISQVTATMPPWEVIARLMVFGIGLGMFMAPNNNAVMSSVPPERRGIASGLLGMFRYTGQGLGIALAGTVFAAFATSGGFTMEGLPSPGQIAAMAPDPAARQALSDAFTKGMRAAALAAVPLAGIGMFLSLLQGSFRMQPSPTVAGLRPVAGGSHGDPLADRERGQRSAGEDGQ